MIKLERKIEIALETGIGAGSVSLLEDGAELDFLVGKCAVLKSGGILILIDTLLKKNEIQKNEIQKVVVSSGPGSLTGIRIGLAIAKGLKDSLQTEYVEVSLLDALVSQTKFAVDFQQNVISAVYVGREEVYYKEFIVESGNKIAVKKNMQVMNLRKFAEKM
ncbi:MAG: tRNA (adenosine(37)-N6)-threonylcarbamoyltransferase complex dimerization subunit type 1 TsaB, partial [Actinomycetota bacterium]